jgi:hypothetical protein
MVVVAEQMRGYIFRSLRGDASRCEWCGVALRILIVAPCVHLFCGDCMEEMGDYCELCR